MFSLTKVNINNMNEPNTTSKNQVENLVTSHKPNFELFGVIGLFHGHFFL
jgi:hypothetical protein